MPERTLKRGDIIRTYTYHGEGDTELGGRRLSSSQAERVGDLNHAKFNSVDVTGFRGK